MSRCSVPQDATGTDNLKERALAAGNGMGSATDPIPRLKVSFDDRGSVVYSRHSLSWVFFLFLLPLQNNEFVLPPGIGHT